MGFGTLNIGRSNAAYGCAERDSGGNIVCIYLRKNLFAYYVRSICVVYIICVVFA